MEPSRIACLSVLASALVVAVITDLRQRRIPNVVSLTALAACLAIRLLASGFGALDGGGALSGLAAALLSGGLFYAVARCGGIGMGDVKLVAAVGAAAGIPQDWRFGLGSRWVNIAREDRRDRLCFILALACILMTLLGQSGEELGLDRSLRANTVKRRTHSLFRQGREYLRGAIGKLAHAPILLWRRFVLLVAAQPQVAEDWGII